MAKLDKLLTQMRHNFRDWRIEDLKRIADQLGIDYRQPGTSHVTFSRCGYTPVVVPAHKPIKPVYVERFIALADSVRGEEHDE